jgi:hypothetical protein
MLELVSTCGSYFKWELYKVLLQHDQSLSRQDQVSIPDPCVPSNQELNREWKNMGGVKVMALVAMLTRSSGNTTSAIMWTEQWNFWSHQSWMFHGVWGEVQNSGAEASPGPCGKHLSMFTKGSHGILKECGQITQQADGFCHMIQA